MTIQVKQIRHVGALLQEQEWTHKWHLHMYNITNGRCRWVAAATKLENAQVHQLSSISGYMGVTIKNVTNLARAGRMTCRIQAWFFMCYTIIFTGVHQAFWNLRIDPSNCYIRNQVTRFWAVQGRFLNRFNRGPWHPDPCHTQPVSDTTDMKVSTSQLQWHRRHCQEEEGGRTPSNKLF